MLQGILRLALNVLKLGDGGIQRAALLVPALGEDPADLLNGLFPDTGSVRPSASSAMCPA